MVVEQEEHLPLYFGEEEEGGDRQFQHVASAFAKVRKYIRKSCDTSRFVLLTQVARCDAGASLLCRPRVRDVLVAMAHATDDDQTLQVCVQSLHLTS